MRTNPIVTYDSRSRATEMVMKICTGLIVLLICIATTVAAVRAFQSLSDWLADAVGADGRAVLTLTNAPWFASRGGPLASNAPGASRAQGAGAPR